MCESAIICGRLPDKSAEPKQLAEELASAKRPAPRRLLRNVERASKTIRILVFPDG